MDRLFSLLHSARGWMLASSAHREAVVYCVVWALLFLSVPFFHVCSFLAGDVSVAPTWIVVRQCVTLSIFLLLFVLNDRLFARLIVPHRNVWAYCLVAILASLVTSCVVEWVGSSLRGRFAQRYEFRQSHDVSRPPLTEPSDSAVAFTPTPDARPPFRPNDQRRHDVDFRRPRQHDTMPHDKFFMGLFMGPFVGNVIVALLMMCFGILVKVYLLAEQDKQRLAELSLQSTAAQLEQLKYQLSPHFMMNTLNNIHALVDIDAERAKDTILRMSKLMRYMLYDGNKPSTPLDSEIAFLRNYVELMRLRFTADVSISLSLPDDTHGIQLPPLLFVNMVENAFKHGISYSHESFVDVSMTISDDLKSLSFCCINSLGSAAQDSQHGIGLRNVRQRLQLLCPGRFQLSAQKKDDCFVATLCLSLPCPQHAPA